MKSHWLITVLLLLATGCKPQQPEPLAIKVKPLPDETVGSSTPVTPLKTATNALSSKADTRSSPTGSPSPKISPTAKATTQNALSSKADTRPSPTGSPSPKISPTAKATTQNAPSTKADTRPTPSRSPTAKATTSASEGVLIASNPKSRINFRSTPSISSKRLGYGTVGERVQIIEQKAGTDGSTWYKVRFPRPGTQGWIRKDFIKVAAKQAPSKSGVPSASPSPSNKPSPKNSKPSP